MVDITIYSKTGVEKAAVKTLEYDGTFMGDRYVSVSVESPIVINWQIGDYLDYRGERWTLWLLPSASKVARIGTYGGAIEYKDIRFCPSEEELRRCSFLDVVLHDNEIHYTSLPNFSFYCATAKDLADRLQANLNRLYPGEWQVTANPAVSITDQSLTFSNNSCWEALAMANTTLGLNFIIDSANREIVIGGEGAFIETVMEYGKGNGLKSVDRTVDDNQQVVNRLYAYGNTRNIPYRYYNKRYSAGTSIYDSVQSMYLPNLMLPGICRGWSAGSASGNIDSNGCTHESYGSAGQKLSYNSSLQRFENPDGTEYVGSRYRYWRHWSLSVDGTMYYCDRVWLDSVESIDKCGAQEGTKFFDGSDELVDDIYPSITGFDSTQDLATALGPEEAAAQNLTQEQGELDEIMSADVESWDGIIPETEETTPTFYIRIKNIGFDLSDAELDASGDTPRLSMKSGMCTGREFNILECKKQVYYGGVWVDFNASSPIAGPWSYYLKCEVAADDSIGQYFPNDSFRLVAGDKFVILGIKMPDVYVDVAENRLLKAAIVWLGENDKTAYNYSPSINNIYMVDNPETSSMLKEGNVLHIYDADLDIDVEMTISQLKIKNDKQIPEYEVTLSNDKEADLVQRVTAQVQQTYTQFIGGGKGGGSGIYLIGMSSNAAPTDNNAFSARRSLSMFLRKDMADTAQGFLTLMQGLASYGDVDFGHFNGAGWLAGTGARIDTDGNAEFENVKVRGSLSASELVFNLIDAEEGESIRSIGHAEIETISMITSTTGVATIKLEGTENPTIAEGDICRGMYSNVGRGYTTYTGEDINGFRSQIGFFTSYFTINSVRTSMVPGGGISKCTISISLQSTDKDGNSVTTYPPCEGMKFVVYGNTSNAGRRSSMYISAVGQSPKLLFLTGVSHYWILPENIKIALGDIGGLRVWEEVSQSEYANYQGEDKATWVDGDSITHYKVLKTLSGDAGFYCEDNIYLGGVIEQFKSAAMEMISSELSNVGQAWVNASDSSFVVDCDADGYVTEAKQLVLDSWLYYGSNLCTLNTGFYNIPICYYQYDGQKRQPTFSENNTKASRTYSFNTGDQLSSGTITIFLKGTYNGTVYSATKTVNIIANRQGATGASASNALPRIRTWDTGMTFYEGDSDEPYIDVAVYNGSFWRCVITHVSSAANAPGSSYWQQANDFKFTATDLLLADQGVIRLLFSQKMLTTNESGQLTASINDDGLGSYCIYYPESGNKKFEFSQSKDIVCYNDNDANSVAWTLGASGLIVRVSGPSWSRVWLNLRSSTTEPANNSFRADDVFTLTAYPEYISGSNGVQSENGKIYKANHDYSDGPNGNYIADGWYTKDEKPYPVLTDNDSNAWGVEVIHIVSGVITQRKTITTIS